jgi:8-oxo-dGTP pyrophosphatase MutT (NUDIX family)
MTPDKGSEDKKTKKEISAGIIVYRRTQEGPKFLILYHGHNYWNFPKGKIESEEKSLAAALRETREETGLSGQDLHLVKNFKTYERFYFRRAGQAYFKIVIILPGGDPEPGDQGFQGAPGLCLVSLPRGP